MRIEGVPLKINFNYVYDGSNNEDITSSSNLKNVHKTQYHEIQTGSPNGVDDEELAIFYHHS